MELHAEYGKLGVLNGHNNALEFCCLLQAVRQFAYAEAVITSGLERIFDAGKYAFLVVRYP